MVPTLLDDVTDVIADVACMCKQPYLIEKNVLHARIQRGGGQGVRTPLLKNHKNIGFLSNIGPDPL